MRGVRTEINVGRAGGRDCDGDSFVTCVTLSPSFYLKAWHAACHAAIFYACRTIRSCIFCIQRTILQAAKEARSSWSYMKNSLNLWCSITLRWRPWERFWTCRKPSIIGSVFRGFAQFICNLSQLFLWALCFPSLLGDKTLDTDESLMGHVKGQKRLCYAPLSLQLPRFFSCILHFFFWVTPVKWEQVSSSVLGDMELTEAPGTVLPFLFVLLKSFGLLILLRVRPVQT